MCLCATPDGWPTPFIKNLNIQPMHFFVLLGASPVLGPRPLHAGAMLTFVFQDVASLVVAGLGPNACQFALISFPRAA